MNKNPFKVIDKHRAELGESIFNQLNSLVSSIPENFLYKPDDLRIYIPVIALRLIMNYVEADRFRKGMVVSMNGVIVSDPMHSLDGPPNMEGGFLHTFRGIKVLEGYEKAIVIAHVRCIEYNDETMVWRAEI